jgi:hypothetical protein
VTALQRAAYEFENSSSDSRPGDFHVASPTAQMPRIEWQCQSQLPSRLRRDLLARRDLEIDGICPGRNEKSVFCEYARRLYRAGKLSASEFPGAKRLSALHASYSEACCSPRQPHSMDLERGSSGMAPDVDSELGAKQVRLHEKIVRSWLEGHEALRQAGPS